MPTRLSGQSKPSRLIRLAGSDNDYIYFETPSWTRRDLVHEIRVSKRDGIIECSCEGCTYSKGRAKNGDIMDPKKDACKHIKGLHIAHWRLLNGEVPSP